MTSSTTTSASRGEPTDANRAAALAAVGELLVPHQARGFFGEIPVVFVLKGGLVDVIEHTGSRETIKIPRPP